MGNDYYATNENMVHSDGSLSLSGEIFGYYPITHQYFARYRLPVMHTETNGLGGQDAVRWLKKEWANVHRLKQDGVPLVGFTWYSLQDQVDWDTGAARKQRPRQPAWPLRSGPEDPAGWPRVQEVDRGNGTTRCRLRATSSGSASSGAAACPGPRERERRERDGQDCSGFAGRAPDRVGGSTRFRFPRRRRERISKRCGSTRRRSDSSRCGTRRPRRSPPAATRSTRDASACVSRRQGPAAFTCSTACTTRNAMASRCWRSPATPSTI